jgi:homoserine kinase type II
MALITPLTPDDVAKLAADFGIELAELEPLHAGSVNSNFRVLDTRGRRYFARLYEEQGVLGARGEVRLLSSLAAAGVPAVAPVPRGDGSFVAEHRGKAFAMFPWVEGEHLCQKQVTPAACRKLGDALARVHLASPPPGTLPQGRFRVTDLVARLDRVERDPEALRYAADVAQIRERLAHYTKLRDPELPRGLVHGDLFRDNVLWNQVLDGEIVALLDFESASEECLAYDVMVCVMAWCYGSEFELDLVAALLGGYHARRPLSERECAGLSIEGAIGALRFATTRITDFSLRAAPGQAWVRDYRRFLERLKALEAGTLEPAIRGLLQ